LENADGCGLVGDLFVPECTVAGFGESDDRVGLPVFELDTKAAVERALVESGLSFCCSAQTMTDELSDCKASGKGRHVPADPLLIAAVHSNLVEFSHIMTPLS
jgi:hypothetical protein